MCCLYKSQVRRVGNATYGLLNDNVWNQLQLEQNYLPAKLSMPTSPTELNEDEVCWNSLSKLIIQDNNVPLLGYF